MAMSLEEFLEIATPEQKEILFVLLEKIEEDEEIHRKIQKIYSYIEGATFSDIIIGSNKDFKDRKENISKLLKWCIEEYDMGDVEIIQKYYRKYVK